MSVRAPHLPAVCSASYAATGIVIASVALLALLLSGCTEPVSWQKLLAARISQQYPGYEPQTTADGQLLVARPGLASVTVDVKDIAAFCLRGPKDCDYATDQMLLGLAKPAAAATPALPASAP